jgi:hypothetical protein
MISYKNQKTMSNKPRNVKIYHNGQEVSVPWKWVEDGISIDVSNLKWGELIVSYDLPPVEQNDAVSDTTESASSTVAGDKKEKQKISDGDIWFKNTFQSLLGAEVYMVELGIKKR